MTGKVEVAEAATGKPGLPASTRVPARQGKRTQVLAHPMLWLGLAATSIIAIIGLSTKVAVDREINSRRDAATQAVTQLVDTYESQLLRSMREIEFTLRLLQVMNESGNGPAATLQFLRAHEMLPPSQIFETSIRADGVSRGPRLAAMDGLFVDVESSPGGSTRLAFHRLVADSPPLRAYVSVDASYFVAALDPQRMGGRGTLALLDPQGELVVQSRSTLTRGDDPSAPSTRLRATAPFMAQRPLFGFPFIAVIGLDEEEQLAAAWERARGYLTVGAIGIAAVLGCTLMLAALYRRLSLERRQHADDLERMAFHDALTGLPNRNLFGTLLQQNLQLAQRQSIPMAVLFLDLDGFKKVNDELGHDAGDELLKQVAQRITTAVRTGDVAARLGGDEFVIMTSHQHASHSAETVAERLIAEIGKPYALGDRQAHVTASIGISNMPETADNAEELMRLADEAMYRAKSSGKNNYVVCGRPGQV